MTRAERVLVGTVGYQNLRNHSIGPLLLPRLQRLCGPAGVDVEELSWGPVAVAQRLQAEQPPFDRIVLLGARASGLAEGTVTLYQWAGGLPDAKAVQARIAEAVTGVISVDNLLVVGEYFQVWPRRLFVIDVAPGRQECGPRPTPRVAVRIPDILDLVRKVALSPTADLPTGLPLAGGELD